MELTFDDFIKRIDIQDLLMDAGYVFNRKDGIRYPAYVRPDSSGHHVKGDKFIVYPSRQTCFQPPEKKVYNVISFITEHPHLFKDYQAGMDPYRLVNLVCNRLLNNPIDRTVHPIIKPSPQVKDFNIRDYELLHFQKYNFDNIKQFYPYFVNRGINTNTQKAFGQHFLLATLRKENGTYFKNLSFPLRIPGKTDAKSTDLKDIVGFEERGRARLDGSSGYKGKARGSNSSEGLWIANLTEKPLEKASEIVWFESAYDAMAEYQINPVKKVYVSTGGTPTEGQMRGLLSITPNARHYLGFDKDDAGRQFVANFRKVAAEMGFRHEHVQAYHPLGCYKDWNDALLNKKSAELIAKGEPDTFDYAEFIAAGKAEYSGIDIDNDGNLSADECDERKKITNFKR
jgi:hypothetical protein